MTTLPKTCLLTVTNSCVLKCKMCGLWQLNTLKEEVNTQECKRFFDQLADFTGEPPEVHLIGGESLIKDGIFELIAHIKAAGSRTVMTSCGYTINEETAKKLVDAGLSILNISLDSLDPGTHNFLRGKEDCFERVSRAIGYLSKLKKNGMILGINTIISAVNLEGIIPLAEWVESNADLDAVYFMAVMRPFGSKEDWGWYKNKEYSFLWPSDMRRVAFVLDRLKDLKRHPGSKIANPVPQLEDFKSYFENPEKFIKTKRCNLTHHAVNVNAIGDIYLCFFMESLGNIRYCNIKDAWGSEKAEAIRRKMMACRQNCELVINCYYGD